MAFMGATPTGGFVNSTWTSLRFLRRLAHPLWFQNFGAKMGTHWHSSGITTSVLRTLKRSLAPCQPSAAPGTRWPRRQSGMTPDEL